MNSITQDKEKKLHIKMLAIAFWIAIWECAYLIVKKEILIVSPFSVFKNLLFLATQSDFYITIFSSIGRILIGFFCAIVISIPLSIATEKSKILKELFTPLLDIIKATPVASFIILALVWIKSNNLPTFISFLMVLPIMWANISLGISSLDKNILEMANIYEYSPIKKLRYVYFPMIFPNFMTGFRTGLGFCWKAGIAAEVIANTKLSIGGEIYNAKIYLETLDLFTYTIVIIILSFVIEKLFLFIMNKIYKIIVK